VKQNNKDEREDNSNAASYSKNFHMILGYFFYKIYNCCTTIYSYTNNIAMQFDVKIRKRGTVQVLIKYYVLLRSTDCTVCPFLSNTGHYVLKKQQPDCY
jgi:hypothetical protein